MSTEATPREGGSGGGLGLLPEPAGFRTRYRSEPGMIGRYPWTYYEPRRRSAERPGHETESLYTEAQVLALLAAERERWKERAIAACNSAGDGPDNGCCPTYWEEAREACIAAIQKA